ncbi:MAG: hypothetical protein KBC64_01745 [Simkaniaceae bacterium]|nr:hypothetical protein [Simkaniaceae bacterium]
MFLEEELKELAERGLIVGPDESEEAFKKRISQMPKGEIVDLSSPYGITPDWLQCSENPSSLFWFQGAATSIDENSVSITFKKNRFVSKEEMLRHEAVHAVRGQFNENKFEEIFAYATSSKKYRRLIGPLFRTEKQTLFLMASCLIGFFFPPIPYLVIGTYALLLTFYQRRLTHTLTLIKDLIGDKDPMSMALHLTDREILHFSKNLLNQDSLRWKQIRARFCLTIV